MVWRRAHVHYVGARFHSLVLKGVPKQAVNCRVFNDGTNQTADLAFKNGGYYNEEGLQGVVTPTAIRNITTETDGETKVYTLDGRLIRTAKNGQEALIGLPKGIYIINQEQ